LNDVLKKLEGGDRRSIGRVSDVVAEVFNDPSLFEVVFNGMLSDDPIIRMRSADAVEKITAKHPEYLQPYKKKLIQQVARIDQQEVRGHVAQMFPRLELSEEEQAVVVEILLDYLNDKSKISRRFPCKPWLISQKGTPVFDSRSSSCWKNSPERAARQWKVGDGNYWKS